MNGKRVVNRSKFGRKLLISFFFLTLALLFSVLADRVAGAFLDRGAAGEGLIFPPKSTFRYQTPEFDFTADINTLGFRDREFDLNQDGETRILAVGDSFTYGWGVGAGESWPKLLEARLRHMGHGVEVANLGQPGASPAAYARIVDKAIPLLKPDLVIVGILQGDDLVPDNNWKPAPEHSAAARGGGAPARATSLTLLRGRISAAGRRMYPNLLRLMDNRSPRQPLSALWKNQAETIIEGLTPEERARFDGIDAGVKRSFVNGELNPALLLGAIKQPNYFLDTHNIDGPEVESLISAMARNLARIKETADRYGCQVVVVSVPYKVYASRRDLESSRRLGLNLIPEMAESDSADKAIENACRAAGVKFFGVTDEFRRAAGTTHLFYEMDGHFNAAGHQTFADLFAPLLARQWFEAK